MILNNGNTFTDDFILLFTQMDTLCLILLLSGLVFCLLDLLRPAFKFFFVIGFLLLSGGTAMRMLSGGTLQMLFVLIFSISLILVAAYFMGVLINKSPWLSRESDNISEPSETIADKEFYFLLNHEGVSSTDLDPSGVIIINDIEFDAFSQNGTIARNVPIRVVEVENEKIVVRPV